MPHTVPSKHATVLVLGQLWNWNRKPCAVHIR